MQEIKKHLSQIREQKLPHLDEEKIEEKEQDEKEKEGEERTKEKEEEETKGEKVVDPSTGAYSRKEGWSRNTILENLLIDMNYLSRYERKSLKTSAKSSISRERKESVLITTTTPEVSLFSLLHLFLFLFFLFNFLPTHLTPRPLSFCIYLLYSRSSFDLTPYQYQQIHSLEKFWKKW
jgi:hypothetical protein